MIRNDEFNRVVDSIRETPVDGALVEAAAARVRSRLEAPAAHAIVDRLRSCADFQALLPEYRDGTLSEARRLLLEDHLHSCVVCRKMSRGETVQKVVAMKPRAIRRWAPLAVAAGVVIAAAVTLPPVLDRALAPSGPRATVASIDGALYKVTAQGTESVAAGSAIGEGEEIRTAKGSIAKLRLADGSMLEMNERSELSLSARWSGATVHLDRGNVIVEAAKQRRGSLQVATSDCLVSVKGTIFAVSRGTKGSRVSVIEGQVKVEQDRISKLLARGEQTSTSPNLADVPVSEDVAWSRQSGRYLQLLGELSEIQKRLEAIPSPGLRYQAQLAQYLPENTVIYAAIPNLGATLAEANKLFEERLRQSEVLREWWNEKHSQELQLVVNQVRAFSEFLGDEVVFAVASENGKLGEPMIVAEAKKPGLRAFLDQQFALMRATGKAGVPRVSEGPEIVAANGRPQIMVRGNIVALAVSPRDLKYVASVADGQSGDAFLRTPLYQRVLDSYRSGAGWVFAADMEQILARNVSDKDRGMSGLNNVKYLVIERKENAGRTENRAALSFSQQRTGMASWLGAPAPMGSLDFTTPDATFAASFVIKNPKVVVQELISFANSISPKAGEELAEFERLTGLSVMNDMAGPLGGELTFSIDGPLLPTPSWKLAVEVYDPSKLQFSIGRLVETMNREEPNAKAQLSSEVVSGRTYYTLRSDQSPIEAIYTYADGFLLAAPNRALLDQAIQNRATGATLANSAGFRAQLPTDGQMNFSGIVYYNLAVAVAPLAQQLKSTGILNPEQQKAIDQFTAQRDPTLIYAYGEPDRITVASRGSFFGLNLDTLVGLSGQGGISLPRLVGPVMKGPRMDAAPKRTQ